MTQQLLARHGVLTRESLNIEAVPRRVRSDLSGPARAWRRTAASGAATSSRAWAPRSSPCPAPSICCDRSGRNRMIQKSRCSRRPIRRIPTARRSKWPTTSNRRARRARRAKILRALGGAPARLPRSAGTRAHAIGRRHGHSRQRRPGGISARAAIASSSPTCPSRSPSDRRPAAPSRACSSTAPARAASRHAACSSRRSTASRQRRIRSRRLLAEAGFVSGALGLQAKLHRQVISPRSSVISRKSPVLSQESSVVSRSRPSPVPSHDDTSITRRSRLRTDDCGLTD